MKRNIRIIAIAGHPGAGKDTAAEYIETKGFTKISNSDYLREKLRAENRPTHRDSLHEFTKSERAKQGNAYPVNEIIEIIKTDTVLVGLRNTEQVKALRERFKEDFTLIAVQAPLNIRYERAKIRNRDGNVSLEQFVEEEMRERKSDSGSHEMDRVIELADFVVENDGSIDNLWSKLDAICSKL